MTASAFHDSGNVNNSLFIKPSATLSRSASPESRTSLFIADQFRKDKPQPIDLAMPTRKKASKSRSSKKSNSRNPSSFSPSRRDFTKASSNCVGSSRANSTSSDSDGRSRSAISSPESNDSKCDSNNLNNSARKLAKDFPKKYDNVNQKNSSVSMDSFEIPPPFAGNKDNTQGSSDQFSGFLDYAASPPQEPNPNSSVLNAGEFVIPNKTKKALKRKAPSQSSEDNLNTVADMNSEPSNNICNNIDKRHHFHIGFRKDHCQQPQQNLLLSPLRPIRGRSL